MVVDYLALKTTDNFKDSVITCISILQCLAVYKRLGRLRGNKTTDISQLCMAGTNFAAHFVLYSIYGADEQCIVGKSE